MKASTPLLLLSPAKTLNFNTALSPVLRSVTPTQPRFLSEANEIAELLGQLPQSKIKALMSLSDSLAALNHARYATFKEQDARIALGAFEGAAYKGMDAPSLDAEAVEYLGKSLRILCGQYGVLRPTDDIRPYRLEMSTKLAVGDAANLYQYWTDRITASLSEELSKRPGAFVLNVASQEYAKAVDFSGLGVPVITAIFPGPAVHAKTARGEMVRFCAQQCLTEPHKLREFTGTRGEWSYVASESSETQFVFHRSASKSKPTAKGKREPETSIEGEPASKRSKPKSR